MTLWARSLAASKACDYSQGIDVGAPGAERMTVSESGTEARIL